MNEYILRDVGDLAESHLDEWLKLKNKTFFITGATGFIGSFIIFFLLHLNDKYGLNLKIIILAQSLDRAKKRFGQHIDNKTIRVIEQNIEASFQIEGDIDFAIHAASKANPIAYMADPSGTITTNVMGTSNVLNALRGKSIKKLVYLSTMEAYGLHGKNDSVTEDTKGAFDSTVIRNCYPISKICAENLCLCHSEQYGTPITIVRLAYIYGAGDNIDDPKVVTAFFKDIKDGKGIVLKSSGSQLRTYCYIKDAVYGILLALLKGENRQIYNISSLNNTVSIKNIAELILDLFGNGKQQLKSVAPSEADKKRFSLEQNNILDNSKIKAIGYRESTDIREGIINTGKYFKLTPNM